MSEELPRGWALSTISDICDSVSKRGPNAERDTFRYIDLGAIDNKSKVIVETNELRTVDAPSRAKQLVCKGDVLFSNVRVYLENIALVSDELDGEVASTAFCVLRPRTGIEPRYLYYFVTSKPFIRTVDALQRGNSPPSVQDGDVKSQSIPVAPTPEQKRIVSKIDELFSSIDEGERAMERVSKLVARYCQSVLRAAVTGELTRDWREARKAAGQPLESSQALLARILTARRDAWEQADVAKMQAKGITPKDEAWKKRYVKPTLPDLSGLPDLPEGWVWTSLPMLCGVDSTNGISVKGTNAPPGVPALRLDAMGDTGFDYAAKRYIPISDSKAEKLRIEAGDFFVSRANGSLSLVGRAVLAQEPPELVVFPDTMIRYRPVDESDVGSWLERAWRSRLVRAQIERKAKTTAGIYKISQGDIAEIAIPMPPFEERAVAISLIDQRLSQIESLSMEQGQSEKRAGALRQAILRSAFSGDLVSQSPEEEPASILLERIAVKQAGPNIAAPKRGRKNKSA